MDNLRAIDYILSKPEVDSKRVVVTGGSQGGGFSLAAAALDSRVTHCMVDLPFLCHFQRAMEISSEGPYPEIMTYLKFHPYLESQVMKTLSYFDNLNLANRIKAKTLVSVGLQDTVCPPSTVYGTFNQIKAPKEMVVYPYLAHEFNSYHADFKIHWLAQEKI
jgi:cephalosporin-C deacetylase